MDDKMIEETERVLKEARKDQAIADKLLFDSIKRINKRNSRENNSR